MLAISYTDSNIYSWDNGVIEFTNGGKTCKDFDNVIIIQKRQFQLAV